MSAASEPVRLFVLVRRGEGGNDALGGWHAADCYAPIDSEIGQRGGYARERVEAVHAFASHSDVERFLGLGRDPTHDRAMRLAWSIVEIMGSTAT